MILLLPSTLGRRLLEQYFAEVESRPIADMAETTVHLIFDRNADIGN